MARAYQSVAYVLQRFLLRRAYLTASADILDLKFRVKTEDVVGRHIYKYGQHEPAMTRWLLDNLALQDGDVVIDIGANIGWYGVLTARLAEKRAVDVVSFEPDPLNFSLLQHNRELNAATKLTCEPLALAAVNGSATLHQHSDSNRGRHSLLPINAAGSQEITTQRLDDYWVERGFGERTPRLIKIDIEGFELAALQGASAVLERCPLLIIEFSPAYMRRGGLDPAELAQLLVKRGGSIDCLAADGTLKAADPMQMIDDQRQTDLICRRDVTA